MDSGLTQLIIQNLAGLGLLFALGWVLARAKWISHEAVTGLARLLIDVTMPALFFVGALGMDMENMSQWWPLMPAGFMVSVTGFCLAWLAHHRVAPKEPARGAFMFLVSIGNTAFLPIPLCYAMWGETGVLACLFYILGNNFAMFSFGIGVLARSAGRKMDLKMLRMTLMHPQALAFAAGLALAFIGWKPVSWLLEPVSMLGKSTIPLAMIAVGAILSEVRWKQQKQNKLLAWTVALKLVALPAIVLMLLKAWQPTAIIAGVLLLQASMPSLASAGVYARRFGGDAGLAASGSLLTTLLCPVALPFWMSFL